MTHQRLNEQFLISAADIQLWLSSPCLAWDLLPGGQSQSVRASG